MGLKIIGVLDRKNNQERLHLEATEDCNLGSFMVLDTTYDSEDNYITDKLRHTYIFPDISVKKNSTVVLYTKSGTYNTITNSNGNLSHFFYWGLKYTVWNNTGDNATVLEFTVSDNKIV